MISTESKPNQSYRRRWFEPRLNTPTDGPQPLAAQGDSPLPRTLSSTATNSTPRSRRHLRRLEGDRVPQLEQLTVGHTVRPPAL